MPSLYFLCASLVVLWTTLNLVSKLRNVQVVVMSTIEQLFSRASLDIIVPSSPFILANVTEDYPAWADAVSADARKLAFYDERLPLLLSLRLPSSSSTSQDPEPTLPPPAVLNLLPRTQLTLEASYIPSLPHPPHTPLTPNPLSARPSSALLLPPPGRTASLRPGQNALPQSMQPPQTPSPTPGTADWDRKYRSVEGVVMGTFVWGEERPGSAPPASGKEDREEGGERFALLWSEKDRGWIALFKMDLTISYLRTKSPDPLLCLTCSATLRDKPLPPTSARSPLQALIQSANISLAPTPDVPQTPYTASTVLTENTNLEDEEEDAARFEEVNLLEGLVGPSFSQSGSGPTDPEPEPLDLPSTRLSHTLRTELFSLPTLASPPSSAAPTGTPTPVTPGTGLGLNMGMGHARTRSAPAIMRKAFRRVLPVVSGIKVRMRASFLPRSGLPEEEEEEDDADGTAGEGARGRRCVLCVEVENAGEGYGFEVERIDVLVSGGDSRTSLITWDVAHPTGGVNGHVPAAKAGAGRGEEEGEGAVFPLRLKAQDQYNLLYTVAFTSWSAYNTTSGSSAPQPGGRNKRGSQMPGQRNVSITVHGRPFAPAEDRDDASTPTLLHPAMVVNGNGIGNGHGQGAKGAGLEYVTNSFPSTWNCTIDVSPSAGLSVPSGLTRPLGERDALPTPHPASPFRPSLPNSAFPGLPNPALGSHPLSPISSPLAPRMIDKRNTLASLHSLPSASSRLSGRPPPPGRSQTLPALNTSLSPPSAVPGSLVSPPRFTPTRPSSLMSVVVGPNGTPVMVPSSPTPSIGPGGARSPRAASIMNGNGKRKSDPIQTPVYPPYSAVPGGGRSKTPVSQLPGSGAEGAKKNRVSFPPSEMGGGDVATGLLSAGGGEMEPILVSVALQYPRRTPPEGTGKPEAASNARQAVEDPSIRPMDRFGLEVFVFNQGRVGRRLVVSYPTGGGRGRRDSLTPADSADPETRLLERSALLPLENHKALGPLMPGTCQSVQLPFLALRPGVHAVDMLELRDEDTGFVLNLRQVMTVVVREAMVDDEREKETIPRGE